MRNLLMDPAFPDIVGAWAHGQCGSDYDSANDNGHDTDEPDEEAELFLIELARLDIEAGRAW